MAILNPDHLFEQADRLIAPLSSGPPRQADLRRAISAAYYGVFHFALTCLADEFIGFSQRASSRYALVYRSLDHGTFKSVCQEVKKATPSARYVPFFPLLGFDSNTIAFAASAAELQEKRHLADYNPQSYFVSSDARIAIGAARGAVAQFRRADSDHRKTFLTLLLCPPR